MDKLLNFSERTTLIIHALGYIVSKKGKPVPSKEISSRLQVSPTYLAKVLQMLVKKGLLKSTRGAHGGFALLKKPEEIMLLDLLVMSEGELPVQFCLLGKPLCAPEKCVFSEINREITRIIRARLEGVDLTEIADKF
ncbi:MAG: Rrf2 family transcriptional regulator [Deltaproteobacteria bacterium]|jgi:Rrf2 family protein|nr:Rrf2 family transcriptional regulator [Deltaproteobacteria bacterium]